MKKLNLALLRASILTTVFALSAASASADTFVYMSGLFGGFDRPDAGAPPATLSGTIVPFNAQGFMVSVNGTYTFTLTADLNAFVPFQVLYENSFDPSTPLSNALIAGGSPFTFDLTAGTTYIIVPTRVTSAIDGGFRGTISGPGAITSVGGEIIPEPATMFLLATGLAGVAVKIRRKDKLKS